jgi:hypothetical protein
LDELCITPGEPCTAAYIDGSDRLSSGDESADNVASQMP